MNDDRPFDPTAPSATDLSADDVDELLSADLDGDFDAAARARGLTPDGARALLAARPEVEARRAALTRARESLGTAPDVDELLDARLVAKAGRAYDAEIEHASDTRARRRRRVWQAAGSVAAAALVVVALVAVGRHGSSEDSAHSSAGATASTGHPPALPTTDYGNVADPAVLRSRVLATLQSPSFSANADSTSAAASQDLRRAAASGASTSAPACATDARTRALASGAFVFAKTGTVEGKVVDVLVFAGPGSSHEVVVTTTDCRVLSEQLLS